MRDSTNRTFENAARANQDRLASELDREFDYIVCGSGSSGSVVAGRLAANPDVSVLLIEAGGSDETEMVLDTDRWPMNLGGELDWSFFTEPNPNLNGRSILYSMGKVLGGGSSINVGTWSRGHKADWDFYAADTGDQNWGYDAIIKLYRDRVEDWTGVPDPEFYGVGGAMHVQPVDHPDAFSLAMLDAADSVGLKRFPNSGGQMMKADGGGSIVDNIIHNGKRQSAYRSYVYPRLLQKNLTVLTGALTTRILFDGSRASGIEFVHNGQLRQVDAKLEIVLSQGAIQTPKLLMQSGIGDQEELRTYGIPVRQHLPGVGRNMHDHVALALVWEATDAPLPQIARSSAVAFWKTNPALDAPNFYTYGIGIPFLTPENAAKYPPPPAAWTLFTGMRPASRGSIHLTGAKPFDPLRIEANYLAEPSDLEDLKLGVQRAREIGNAAPLRPYAKREHAPANLTGLALEEYIRNGLVTFWHQAGTAKMGRDAMSVVDSELKVYGVEGLRIADASILPRVTTGNTMAPCVIIGERAAELLQQHHEKESVHSEDMFLQSTKWRLSVMAIRTRAKLAVAGLSTLAVLQFVRPGIPSGPMIAEIQVPPRARQILQKDCYSCHSNERRLAWFDEITPPYWLVRHDILAAREHLNFSTMGSEPVAAQRATLFEAVNMIQLGVMPLPQFIALHPDAKVTPAELMELKGYLAPWNPADGSETARRSNADESSFQTNLGTIPAELNGLPFEPGFESWKPLSFTDRGDNNTFRMILGNEIAVKAAETGSISPWPDGARFAKIAWQQEKGEDGLVYPGRFVQVEFMVKQAAQYRDTDGWGWGRWRGLNLKPYGTGSHFVAECTGCHAPVRGDDFVYTLPITTAKSGRQEAVNSGAAALPKSLPYLPLQWTAITMFVDPDTRTMSTFFGNDIAVRAVRSRVGNFGKPPAYPVGSVIALLTWAQRDDPHWFGGRIPDRPVSVELAEMDASSKVRSYRRFDGPMLQERTAPAEEVARRTSFLMSLVPATLP